MIRTSRKRQAHEALESLRRDGAFLRGMTIGFGVGEASLRCSPGLVGVTQPNFERHVQAARPDKLSALEIATFVADIAVETHSISVELIRSRGQADRTLPLRLSAYFRSSLSSEDSHALHVDFGYDMAAHTLQTAQLLAQPLVWQSQTKERDEGLYEGPKILVYDLAAIEAELPGWPEQAVAFGGLVGQAAGLAEDIYGSG